MKQEKLSLEDRLMRVLHRYTFGAKRPAFLLLHPADMARLRVRNGAEWDEMRGQWGPIMFSGIEVRESKLCEQHEPLAVVRDYAK